MQLRTLAPHHGTAHWLRYHAQPSSGADGERFLLPQVIASELAKALEDEIVFGTLAPGCRLVEEEIVTRFKVSRSPVREALRTLESEGLAIRQPRRGMRVTDLSVDDLNDLFDCRIPLVCQAVEAASLKRNAEHLAYIEQSLTQMHQSVDDPRKYYEANLFFWQTIHEASGSRTLQRLLNAVGKHSYRYRYLGYLQDPNFMDDSLQFRADIMAAIANRDGAKCRAVTAQFMEQARMVQRQAIIASPPPAG